MVTRLHNGDTVVQNLNRREDPIFQLFSVSELLQFRGGTRYALSRTISAVNDHGTTTPPPNDTGCPMSDTGRYDAFRS